MSESTPTANSLGYGPIKPLAVRLDDRTVADEIRLALEARLEKAKADPSVLQRAESVRAVID